MVLTPSQYNNPKKRDLSPTSQDKWTRIYNQVMSSTGDKKKATQAANQFTRSSLERRLRKDNGGP